jgi:hypothetical protein
MIEKMFDIDINVWDIERNVIDPIPFHGQSNSTISI